jgi:hypothetical protein
MKSGVNPWVVVSLVLVGVVGYGVFYFNDQKAAQKERDAVALRNHDAVQNYNPNAAPIVPFPDYPPKKTVHV